MNKAEAIEVIRKNWPDASFTQLRGALETLIPELKESEDERIRKEIIDFIQWAEDRGMTRHDYHQAKRPAEWLVWLEKQKEQKPVEQIAKDNEITSNPEYNPNYHDELSQCKDVLFNIATILSKYEDKEGSPLEQIRSVIVDSIAHGVCLEEEKKEQQPVEKQDYTDLDDLERAILRGFLAAGVENVPVTIIEETAQECLAQIDKPEEWSKNDTVFLNEITDFFENKTVRRQHDIDMYAHWLKSLPERFSLQPKLEWSEEDSKRYVSIRTTLETSAVLSKEDYDANVVWLRDLVNAKKYSGPKPSWKPSKKQMEALGNCVLGRTPDADARITLEILWDNLQKLL